MIQPIYAVTLELESAAEDVAVAPTVARERIDVVIDQLSEVIKNMRRHLLGVQPVSTADQALPEALAALLAETRAEAVLETDLSVHGAGMHDLPAPLAQDLLQIAREAVANVVRQARAGRVWVTLDVREHEVHLTIRDNGIACDTRNAPTSGHYAWRSVQEWAQGLGGAATIQSARGQGTVVEVRVPVAMPERAAGPRGHEQGAGTHARAGSGGPQGPAGPADGAGAAHSGPDRRGQDQPGDREYGLPVREGGQGTHGQCEWREDDIVPGSAQSYSQSSARSSSCRA